MATETSNSKYFNANASDVAVGTKSVLILPRNSKRTNALFINDSDTTIYLGIGVQAKLNSGIRLNAGGGNYSMNELEKNLSNENVFAICSSDDKKIIITEHTE